MWFEAMKKMKESSGLTTKEISAGSRIPEPTLEKLFAGVTKDPKLETMRQLVHFLGYTLDDLYGGKKSTPLYSSGALVLARDYDLLDSHGCRVVRDLMDVELERMEQLAELVEAEPKVINLFLEPSAAGLALSETNQLCEPYTLTRNDPQDAAYAVRIQGDSMEPLFSDGQIAFVNHDTMRDGDVGIFCVDGATVCKQYHYDSALGITYLFSLNRKRSDADLVFPRESERTLVWQGRVITRRSYPLPGL